MEGCFDLSNTKQVMQDLLEQHGCVDAYIESIKDYKEVLTDPNQFLSLPDQRLGKGKPIKVWIDMTLTKTQDHFCRFCLVKNTSMNRFFLATCIMTRSSSGTTNTTPVLYFYHSYSEQYMTGLLATKNYKILLKMAFYF